MHHVISGRGSYTAGGVTHEVGAGDTFIVYPSVIVTYRADDADPWEYCWVGFNGAEAKLLMAQTPFTREKPVVRFEDPACRNDFVVDDQCRRTHDAIAGDLGKVRDILDFGVNPQMLYGFFRSSQEGFTFATATA